MPRRGTPRGRGLRDQRRPRGGRGGRDRRRDRRGPPATRGRGVGWVLGLARMVWLGYSDSGMTGWEQNDAEASFHRADLDEAARSLADVLDEEDADFLVGYDWHGGYGHPDHVQGPSPWSTAPPRWPRRTPRLLESTMNRTAMPRRLRGGSQRRRGDQDVRPRRPDGRRQPARHPRGRDHLGGRRLGVPRPQRRGRLEAHKSARRPTSTQFLSMPPEVFARFFGSEYYIEPARRRTDAPRLALRRRVTDPCGADTPYDTRRVAARTVGYTCDNQRASASRRSSCPGPSGRPRAARPAPGTASRRRSPARPRRRSGSTPGRRRARRRRRGAGRGCACAARRRAAWRTSRPTPVDVERLERADLEDAVLEVAAEERRLDVVAREAPGHLGEVVGAEGEELRRLRRSRRRSRPRAAARSSCRPCGVRRARAPRSTSAATSAT